MKVGELHAMELALATNLNIMPTIDVGHGSELFMAKCSHFIEIKLWTWIC